MCVAPRWANSAARALPLPDRAAPATLRRDRRDADIEAVALVAGAPVRDPVQGHRRSSRRHAFASQKLNRARGDSRNHVRKGADPRLDPHAHAASARRSAATERVDLLQGFLDLRLVLPADRKAHAQIFGGETGERTRRSPSSLSKTLVAPIRSMRRLSFSPRRPRRLSMMSIARRARANALGPA